jgi:glycosyltransferase involved in cell wall biosynthesis
MRITHYASSLSQSAGGLFYSVSGLAKAQRALGADVSIVGGADATFAEDRAIWGDLPVETFRLKGLGAYSFSPRVARLLVASKPDILHVHGIWSEAAVYGRIASVLGIPTVCSPHGMLDPWIVARRSLVKQVHGALFERPFLKRSLIRALNESERQSAVTFFAPEPVRIFVAPNGVDLPAHPPAGQDGRKGVLYIGRVHEKKQVLELISHWASETALNDITLTIAGWGEPAYETRVSQACAATSNVRFVGRAYGEAKAALLAQARWFILPSLSEGLPMAVLEAMAAGCIPIITRECNLPELVDEGSAIGIKADFSDFAAVAARMASTDVAQAAALQANALRAVQRFAWSSVARRVLDNCAELLATRSR